MSHSISPEVSSILKRSLCTGRQLDLPAGQLDPKTYKAVAKVLDLAGFKWDRKSKSHLATVGTAAENLTKALGEGEIVDPKQEFDYFQTPEELALRMAEMLGAKSHHSFLEPSAGGGRLCRAVLEFYPKISKDQIWFFEIQYNLRVALVDDGFQYIESDFSSSKTAEKFDRIIANFPFSNGQDIAHCRKAYDCLRPGGRMVCITGPSWQWRTQKKFVEFKTWINSLARVLIEPLPAGTFKDSGTNVPALLLVIDKE